MYVLYCINACIHHTIVCSCMCVCMLSKCVKCDFNIPSKPHAHTHTHMHNMQSIESIEKLLTSHTHTHNMQSIESIEKLLTSSPPASLQPCFFANLAAAYELESGRSLARKLTFLPLLGAHVCEGLQLQALNIR